MIGIYSYILEVMLPLVSMVWAANSGQRDDRLHASAGPTADRPPWWRPNDPPSSSKSTKGTLSGPLLRFRRTLTASAVAVLSTFPSIAVSARRLASGRGQAHGQAGKDKPAPALIVFGRDEADRPPASAFG